MLRQKPREEGQIDRQTHIDTDNHRQSQTVTDSEKGSQGDQSGSEGEGSWQFLFVGENTHVSAAVGS